MSRLGPAMGAAGHMRGNMNRPPLLGNRLGPPRQANSYNRQSGDYDNDGPAGGGGGGGGGGLMSRVVMQDQGASREEALEEAKKVRLITYMICIYD